MVFFAENNDWLTVSSSGIADDNDDITFCCWIRPSSAQVNGTPVVIGFSDNTLSNYFVVIFDTVFWSVYYQNGVGEFANLAFGLREPGVWSWIAVARQWTGVTWDVACYYKRASELGSNGWTLQLGTEFFVTQGACAWTNFHLANLASIVPYRGDLVSARVWNRCLFEAELWEEMMRSRPVFRQTNANNLRGAWTLLPDRRDDSGQGNDLTLGGANAPADGDQPPIIITPSSPFYHLYRATANVGGGMAVELEGIPPVRPRAPIIKTCPSAIELAGLAPSRPVPPHIPLPLGAIELAAIAPTRPRPPFLLTTPAALEVAGFAPSRPVPPHVPVPLGVLEVAGLAPTVLRGPHIPVPLGVVVLEALAPTVILGPHIAVPLAVVELEAMPPTVVTDPATIVTTPLAPIELEAFAPLVVKGPELFVPLSTVELEAQCPTVVRGPELFAPLGVLELEAFTPSVANVPRILVPLAFVELRGFEPTVFTGGPIATGYDGTVVTIQDDSIRASSGDDSIVATLETAEVVATQADDIRATVDDGGATATVEGEP